MLYHLIPNLCSSLGSILIKFHHYLDQFISVMVDVVWVLLVMLMVTISVYSTRLVLTNLTIVIVKGILTSLSQVFVNGKESMIMNT